MFANTVRRAGKPDSQIGDLAALILLKARAHDLAIIVAGELVDDSGRAVHDMLNYALCPLLLHYQIGGHRYAARDASTAICSRASRSGRSCHRIAISATSCRTRRRLT